MNSTPWWRRIFGGKNKGGQSAQEGGRSTKQTAKKSAGAQRPTVQQPTGKPGRRPALDPALPVLGVDISREGWLGALLEASGHGTPHLFLADDLPGLLEQAGDVAVVALPVPIGLPDDSRRDAEKQARVLLGKQSASVLTTPVRDAVYADSHGEASALNREKVGSGVSSEAWKLRRQIREVDAWVRQDLPAVVVETHPEAAFTTMAETPLQTRRRTGEGSVERKGVLAANGVYAPTTVPHGVSTEDVLDACAAAWSAHRVKTGQARTLPEQPQTFSDGIPSAIHI